MFFSYITAYHFLFKPAFYGETTCREEMASDNEFSVQDFTAERTGEGVVNMSTNNGYNGYQTDQSWREVSKQSGFLNDNVAQPIYDASPIALDHHRQALGNHADLRVFPDTVFTSNINTNAPKAGSPGEGLMSYGRSFSNDCSYGEEFSVPASTSSNEASLDSQADDFEVFWRPASLHRLFQIISLQDDHLLSFDFSDNANTATEPSNQESMRDDGDVLESFRAFSNHDAHSSQWEFHDDLNVSEPTNDVDITQPQSSSSSASSVAECALLEAAEHWWQEFPNLDIVDVLFLLYYY